MSEDTHIVAPLIFRPYFQRRDLALVLRLFPDRGTPDTRRRFTCYEPQQPAARHMTGGAPAGDTSYFTSYISSADGGWHRTPSATTVRPVPSYGCPARRPPQSPGGRTSPGHGQSSAPPTVRAAVPTASPRDHRAAHLPDHSSAPPATVVGH